MKFYMLKRIAWKLQRLKKMIAIRFCDEYSIAEYYRKDQGVKIGEHCRIMGKRLDMFGSEPYLVEIGDYVTVADDVKFITHDGGVGILRGQVPNLNIFGRIVIRDNCFIGISSILMPNITIGPNSVVGAGAVVTHDVPPNSIVAGIPAKVIMSMDEYLQKAVAKGLILTCKDPTKRRNAILKHLS
jgi:acetyltransferase-like isoleucine patch superfamily enzyme